MGIGIRGYPLTVNAFRQRVNRIHAELVPLDRARDVDLENT